MIRNSTISHHARMDLERRNNAHLTPEVRESRTYVEAISYRVHADRREAANQLLKSFRDQLMFPPGHLKETVVGVLIKELGSRFGEVAFEMPEDFLNAARAAYLAASRYDGPSMWERKSREAYRLLEPS